MAASGTLGRVTDPSTERAHIDEVVASWSLLVRYHRRVLAAMDASLREQTGRSLDEYDALHQIAEHPGPIRMGDLAERLVVANSSCHRIVGRLVDDGHVRRARGTTDRREVLVDLTPSGRRLRRRMAVVHTRDIHRLFGAPLSPEQHHELARMLTVLDDVARGAAAGPLAS